MKSPFDRINRLPPYVFNVIGELKTEARAKGNDVIDLSMGNPDGMTPPHIVDKLIETANKPGVHRYSASKGIPRLRQAMSDWYQDKYDVELDADDEVIVTIGSKEGLAHLAMATLEAGDTVLVPNPAYPIHPYGVVIAGAQVRHVPLESEQDFLSALEDAIVQTWPKPKMLVLNFPANPTGQCVDLYFYERVVRLAEAHQLWVVNDLAYAELVYDGYKAPSILQVDGAKSVAVEFYSLSKSYNMAGWRIGFCCGNPTLVSALARLKSYMDYGAFTPLQVAAISALKGPQDCVEEIRTMYRSRRDALCEGLNQLGWDVTPPKATMFVWAKIPDLFRHLGSLEFSKLLVSEADVAVSPGVGFGQYGEGYVRFALIENEQRIRQAVKNIKRLFAREKNRPVSDFVSYKSTRGGDETFTFEQVVMTGLARNGGLFVPAFIPDVRERLERWQTLNYKQLAVEVITLFAGPSVDKKTLRHIVEKSYATFSHDEVTPLVHTKDLSILELFHGPTHAFKDVALQLLGNLFEHFLMDKESKLNILGATSGDTGSAAIHGVLGKDNINIFMLHPKGRVSKVQEQQMTSVLDDNVVNVAVEGTFDDCQHIVKQLFNDLHFRDDYNLGAVNSINWARILAQVVYYFYATFKFLKSYPSEPVIFSVPTGNFGDVYAGYIAKCMGLPIEKLIIATNDNNILERTITRGVYKVDEVRHTPSPAMDIQVASNFERFLYDLCGQDGALVADKMKQLSERGEYDLGNEQLANMRQFFSVHSVSQAETYDTMASLLEEGVSCDPHTAVGIAAAKKFTSMRVICLATAHPAKFPESVKEATGKAPTKTPSIEELEGKATRCERASADATAIKKLIVDKVALTATP